MKKKYSKVDDQIQKEITKSNVKRIHTLSYPTAFAYLLAAGVMHFLDGGVVYYKYAFIVFSILTFVFASHLDPKRNHKVSHNNLMTFIALYLFSLLGSILSIFDTLHGSPPFLYFVFFATAVSFVIFIPSQLIIYNITNMCVFLLAFSQHNSLTFHFIFILVVFHIIFTVVGLEKYKERYNNIASSLELKKLNHELKVLSTVDQLTGCKNRRGLLYEMDNYINKEIFTMLIDIDDLKVLNDTFGHDTGDLYIVNFAKLLQSHFGINNVFRLGGDEFFVLSNNLSEDNFLYNYDRFKNEVGHVSLVSKSKYKLTASAGYNYNIVDGSKSFDELFKSLDVALYKSKNNGKNTISKAK